MRKWSDWIVAVCALGLGAACSSSGTASQCSTLNVTVSPGMAKTPAHLVATSSFDSRGLAWEHAWTVTRGGDNTPIPFKAKDPSQAAIEVDVNDPGSYKFEVVLTHGKDVCSSSGSATVVLPNAKSAAFTLRVTPPVQSGLPRQDTTVVMYEGTPLDHQEITLASGLPIEGTLTDGAQAPVAGTVRLLSDAGNDVLAAAGADGRFSALVVATDKYRPVLVPVAPSLAPSLGAAMSGAALVAFPFRVTGGATIGGTVRDGKGLPVAGARVLLRVGDKPSGIGVTDGKGAYSLRAEAGIGWVVTVQADGRPEITSGPITVKDGSVVDVAWTALPLYAVTSTVVADDGTTGMGGARVTVRTAKAIGQAGKVTVDGVGSDAVGSVALVVKSAQDGTLPPLSLPAGGYDLVAQPPDGTNDGITASHEVLAQAAAWTIEMHKPTQLTGIVTDMNGLALNNARVSVVPLGGLGVAPAMVTGPDGRYALATEPGLAADLFVDPPLYTDPNRHYQRAHAPLAAGQAVADVKLEKGLLLRGTLRGQNGMALGGARVEAYCAACNDATPAGVAATGSDGLFTIYLPDPGL